MPAYRHVTGGQDCTIPIKNSDIIHLRRADGRDWDGILHVNPDLKQKGFALLYNSLKEKITRQISLPLYYTGLTDKAVIRMEGGQPKTYQLDRSYHVNVTVEIPAEGYVNLSVY